MSFRVTPRRHEVPGGGCIAVLCLGMLAVAAVLGACSQSSSGTERQGSGSAIAHGPGGTASLAASARPSYLVYWDQNEEVDFLSMPSSLQGVLMPPWDLNGQVCVLPDGSGRFVGGYDPTLPNQHNPGGLLPYKQPPIGEELDLPNGAFSGQTLYVPGPYKLPGETVGGDSPPTSAGVFNDNSTYEGCTFDRRGDLIAGDIATAQGSFPVPDDGRLVEWFAPSYKTSCILVGPISGGTGPHHVDGTGGLSEPGTMAVTDSGDILVPEAGKDQVIEVDHSSLPSGPEACPNGVYPTGSLRMSVFFQGKGNLLPFPAGIARDPTCDCYAISSYFGNPSIIWVSSNGQPVPGHGSVPGETLSQLGQDPNGYNPFGVAVAPDGTLYFVDIHITCSGPGLLQGCGPANYGGRVMKVADPGGQPGAPQVVAGGFDFPTSVTICLPAKTDCPYPTGPIVPPHSGPSENPSPATGPPTTAPATAGFG